MYGGKSTLSASADRKAANRMMIIILQFLVAAATTRLFAVGFTPPISRDSPIGATSNCYSLHRHDTSCTSTQHRAKELCERRRDLIISSIGVASSLLPWYPSTPFISRANAEGASYQRISSTKETAQFILKICNSEFLSSVIKSKYNFLYRGLSQDESEAVVNGNALSAIIINNEPYDLLDPGTYQSNESAAYFQSLEYEMRGMPIKPSNGHLATTCPKEAAQWGRAASIWPLGEEGVDFAWLEEGGLFWPINKTKLNAKKRKIVTSSAVSSGTKQKDLADALQGDAWEVMFRADNGFLVVPAELDDELRAYLNI